MKNNIKNVQFINAEDELLCTVNDVSDKRMPQNKYLVVLWSHGVGVSALEACLNILHYLRLVSHYTFHPEGKKVL